MPAKASQDLSHEATQDTKEVRRVLIVDDSRLQRRILLASLKRWGFETVEAETGEEALELCRERHFDLILSDWMMPGMTGPEFCEAFRALDKEAYSYFILLTSKSEKGEIAHGLGAGADDFLIKPVHAGELRARMSAGQRILEMQSELSRKNALIGETLAKMEGLYDALDRDLQEAKKLQQSLIPKRYQDFHTAKLSLLLRSSGHVGGDLVGAFPVNEQILGIFSIDVSGHGVSSALMTARLAGYLSPSNPEQNIAIKKDFDGTQIPIAPDRVVSELNRLMFEELETEHYFTIALGFVHLESGYLQACQAGHPHPLILHKDGTYTMLGTGGPPVGLLEEVPFETFEAHLKPGDKLLLGSDGLTECEDKDGNQLEDEGLGDLLVQNQELKGLALLETLVGDLAVFGGSEEFTDDVSALLLEFRA